MDRFIDELIKRLKEEREEKITMPVRWAYARAIEIIKQLAKEYNNGWVFCSEKLPYYYENVLVCTENGGKTIAHLKHTPIEWVDMYANKIEGVVAWQYLPNPYKECER